MSSARGAEGQRDSLTRPEPTASTWHGAARWAWTTLLTVQILLAVAALAGGLGLVLTDGLGTPRSALIGTPFASFFWPGLLLFLVIGGTQVMAAVLQLRGSIWYLAAAGFAGGSLLVWIFVQVAILADSSALPPIIFAIALLQMVLAGLCRGVIPEEHGPTGRSPLAQLGPGAEGEPPRDGELTWRTECSSPWAAPHAVREPCVGRPDARPPSTPKSTS